MMLKETFRWNLSGPSMNMSLFGLLPFPNICMFIDFCQHKNKDLKGEIEFWLCFCCARFQIHCVTRRWHLSQGKRTWVPKRGESWRGRWKRFWKRRRGLKGKESWWQWKLLVQQQASKPLITSPGETCALAEQRKEITQRNEKMTKYRILCSSWVYQLPIQTHSLHLSLQLGWKPHRVEVPEDQTDVVTAAHLWLWKGNSQE